MCECGTRLGRALFASEGNSSEGSATTHSPRLATTANSGTAPAAAPAAAAAAAAAAAFRPLDWLGEYGRVGQVAGGGEVVNSKLLSCARLHFSGGTESLGRPARSTRSRSPKILEPRSIQLPIVIRRSNAPLGSPPPPPLHPSRRFRFTQLLLL